MHMHGYEITSVVSDSLQRVCACACVCVFSYSVVSGSLQPHGLSSFRVFSSLDSSFICVCVYLCVCAQSCPTLCDAHGLSPARLLSTEFSRQECWSRLPFLTPGDLPDPGIEPASPALAGKFFYHCVTWEAHLFLALNIISLFGCSTIYLSILVLKSILVASRF